LIEVAKERIFDPTKTVSEMTYSLDTSTLSIFTIAQEQSRIFS